MAKGSKTKKAGGAAMGAMAVIPVDPSGTAIVTAFLFGTAATIGATYHLGRKSAKFILKEMEENRHVKANNNRIGMSISSHTIMQTQVESYLRQLASTMMGAGITGVLFTAMPHMGVGFVINVGEAGYAAIKLQDIARSVGGKRVLLSTISKRNAALQVLSGIFIKSTTTVLFLGSELDFFFQHTSEALQTVSVSGTEKAQAALEFHKEMIEYHPIHETVNMMNDASDKIKKVAIDSVTYEGLNLDTPDKEIAWEDNAPAETILKFGAASAALNKIAEVAIEVPMDEGAKKVTGSA